jgi:polar amino acid transport system substrate-binding protein
VNSRFLLVLLLVSGLCLQSAEAREYDEVIDSGYIDIAVYNDFPPYSFKQGGQPAGIDIEVGKLIAEKLGVEARWFWINPDETLDDDLRNAVWKGHILTRKVADLMMRVPYDPEYSRLMDGYGKLKNDMVVMFGPYHHERWWIARDKNKTGEIRTLANFQYLPIGVEIDTLPDFFLTGVWGGRLRPQVRHYDTINSALKDLQTGKLAAVVGTRSQLDWGLKDADKNIDLSSDGLSGINHQDWDIGMAVRTNFRQLGYAIGDIVNELVQQGQLKKVFDHYQLNYQKPSTYQ